MPSDEPTWDDTTEVEPTWDNTAPVQTEEPPQQPPRIPSAYIPPDVEKEVTQKFDEAHPIVGAAAQGLGDVASGIPQMVAQLPVMAYEGLKFASQPQERGKILSEVVPQALEQGRQMASDVQAPLGTRESFRGIANVGLMALPVLGEVGGLSRVLFGRGAPEPPPIQTTNLRDVLFGRENPTATAATEAVVEPTIERTGEPNAITQPSTEGVPQPEVRTPVGEGAPLRQQGETAEARQGTEAQPQTQEVAPTIPQPEQLGGGEPASRPQLVGEELARRGNPAGLTAAFKLEDGSIISGKPGEVIHAAPTAEITGGKYVKETGFVTPDGKFLNREQAAGVSRKARADTAHPIQSTPEAVVPTTPEIKRNDIPPDAIVQIRGRKVGGGEGIVELDARTAEGRLTKERSSFQTLLDCLGR